MIIEYNFQSPLKIISQKIKLIEEVNYNVKIR